MSVFVIKGRQGRNSNKAGPDGEDMEECSLTGLILMACSACFPVEGRTTSPRMAPPTKVWALPHESLIKNMPYIWILRGIFLNCASLLSNNSSLYQVGIKLASPK